MYTIVQRTINRISTSHSWTFMKEIIDSPNVNTFRKIVMILVATMVSTHTMFNRKFTVSEVRLGSTRIIALCWHTTGVEYNKFERVTKYKWASIFSYYIRCGCVFENIQCYIRVSTQQKYSEMKHKCMRFSFSWIFSKLVDVFHLFHEHFVGTLYSVMYVCLGEWEVTEPYTIDVHFFLKK